MDRVSENIGWYEGSQFLIVTDLIVTPLDAAIVGGTIICTYALSIIMKIFIYCPK